MIKAAAYARSDVTHPALSMAVEIRGYNSQHLDIIAKLYHRYGILEEKIKKTIARFVARGRIEIRRHPLDP
ncbi:MAG: YicC/YloC family endoribonuclease [Desulfobacterales bacterium]